MTEIEQLRAEIRELRAQMRDTAAFLDRLAEHLEHWDQRRVDDPAAEFRAEARKLRGET